MDTRLLQLFFTFLCQNIDVIPFHTLAVTTVFLRARSRCQFPCLGGKVQLVEVVLRPVHALGVLRSPCRSMSRRELRFLEQSADLVRCELTDPTSERAPILHRVEVLAGAGSVEDIDRKETAVVQNVGTFPDHDAPIGRVWQAP